MLGRYTLGYGFTRTQSPTVTIALDLKFRRSGPAQCFTAATGERFVCSVWTGTSRAI
jgi:hypothetical protein